MSKRAPFIAVRTDVVKDESFACLGDIAGYNRDEAFGRMFRLWAFCRDRKLEDAPDDCRGYAVNEALVRRFLGPRGVEAVLADGCDELALGERFRDGLIYLRGTSETVEALRAARRSAEAGGVARSVAASRTSGGRFSGSSSAESYCVSADTQICSGTHNQSSRHQPANQPPPAGEPAATSLPPSSFLLTPDPDLEHVPPEENSASRKATRSARAPSGPHQEAVARFTELYSEATGGQVYDWRGKSPKLIADLVKAHGVAEVKRRTEILFAGKGPHWLQPPFTVGTLSSQWNALASESKGPARGHAPSSSPIERAMERVHAAEAAEAAERDRRLL